MSKYYYSLILKLHLFNMLSVILKNMVENQKGFFSLLFFSSKTKDIYKLQFFELESLRIKSFMNSINLYK